ncbi:MAG: DNA polymerase III subunit beta [Mariprofundaceae bacterium]
MKITLPRHSILQSVQRCQNIVEKRHTVPILSNILLQASDDILHMTATDLEVGIRTQVQASVQTPGAATVSARKLFDIIKELDPDNDVDLEIVEDAFMHIRSGRAKFRLSTLPADDYPSISEDESTVSVNLSGPDLAAMIAATSFAMSQDETRKYLTGTLFEIDKNQYLHLVATDGHRLALTKRHLQQELAPCQCIVPRKAVMEIRRLAEEVDSQIELYLGERQLRLVCGEHSLSTKLIDARFPAYDDVIPSDNPATMLINRSSLDQVLRRSMIVANEFTHDVKLQFSDQGVHISAHNTEQEEAEELVEADYAGQEVSIGFNGRYLRDVLGVMHSEHVSVKLKDELSPVLLHEEGKDGSCYVIMPMRI